MLVPEVGYSPGAVQRRILLLLNGYLRFITVTISGATYHDDPPSVTNIAVLKREEGIGRLRNPS